VLPLAGLLLCQTPERAASGGLGIAGAPLATTASAALQKVLATEATGRFGVERP
jgi:hypothetical protein